MAIQPVGNNPYNFHAAAAAGIDPFTIDQPGQHLGNGVYNSPYMPHPSGVMPNYPGTPMHPMQQRSVFSAEGGLAILKSAVGAIFGGTVGFLKDTVVGMTHGKDGKFSLWKTLKSAVTVSLGVAAVALTGGWAAVPLGLMGLAKFDPELFKRGANWVDHMANGRFEHAVAESYNVGKAATGTVLSFTAVRGGVAAVTGRAPVGIMGTLKEGVRTTYRGAPGAYNIFRGNVSNYWAQVQAARGTAATTGSNTTAMTIYNPATARVNHFLHNMSGGRVNTGTLGEVPSYARAIIDTARPHVRPFFTAPLQAGNRLNAANVAALAYTGFDPHTNWFNPYRHQFDPRMYDQSMYIPPGAEDFQGAPYGSPYGAYDPTMAGAY